jgi:hypothetical protein
VVTQQPSQGGGGSENLVGQLTGAATGAAAGVVTGAATGAATGLASFLNLPLPLDPSTLTRLWNVFPSLSPSPSTTTDDPPLLVTLANGQTGYADPLTAGTPPPHGMFFPVGPSSPAPLGAPPGTSSTVVVNLHALHNGTAAVPVPQWPQVVAPWTAAQDPAPAGWAAVDQALSQYEFRFAWHWLRHRHGP